MSCPVNLAALPSGVLEAVCTPENLRVRTSTMNSLTPLSFPKSRAALWDGSPAGEKLRLQLCAYRKPRLVLLEKALRLAQRHVRHSNKPRLLCFLLGSLSVNADEKGVTVTLDRFDPGRDQAGARVPSAPLPGDVLVPCLFSIQTESDTVVQSEAELHQCFKVLQQCVSSRQTLDVSQLIKVRGRVICCQQSDAATFSLSWAAVCPSSSVDVQPVRAVPIIPTALLRSLTSIHRPPHATSRQRGFLTMDQTRKLLLLLESDPKASSLPLVGLWLSGVTHVHHPQVWAWCLRFLYSSALQDRVLSERRCFLLVLFASTHRTPQFFQCRGPEPGPGPGAGPQLDYQLLTASQCVTLYQQVVSVEGQTLQCDLGSEDHSRQMEVFREAQTSFSRAAGLSVSDQDSGVEDEDLSPRPSPSPHPPAQQTRRVQPSVPELSLLIDSSFTSNHSGWLEVGPAHRLPPPTVDRKSAPPSRNTTTSSSSPSAPRSAAPPHLHSTPNSNLQQSCSCCSTPHTYNCTSIFSSPGHLPAASPPAASSLYHHHTPPPSKSHASTPFPPSSLHPAPPYSNHHTPPPSSLHPAAPPPLAAASSHRHNTPPPPPPPSSHHHAPAPPSSHPHMPPMSSLHRAAPPPLAAASSHRHNTPPPPSSHHHIPLPSSLHPALPLHAQSSNHNTPLSKIHLSTPAPPQPSSHHPSPAASSLHPAAPPPPPPSSHHNTLPLCSSHSSPPPPPLSSHFHSSPPSPHLSAPPHPVSPPWFSRPPCVNQCCNQAGGGLPPDTYQLLLHQDQQLRLLQAQVQMLLEAQGKLQTSSQQLDTQTAKTTASIAVGTGASLFWGNPVQPSLLHQEAPPSSPTPPPSSSSSSCRPPSHADLSINGPVGGAEDGDVTGQEVTCSPSGQHSVSRLQSPVLGESVSMYRPAEDQSQQSFYHNLMSQLTSRLQESDSKQEVEEEEEEESRRRSLSVVSDCSRSSQSSKSSQTSQSSRRGQSCGDPVVSATVKQLQQLGVNVDEEDLTELDRKLHQTVENASTLASISPSAVLSQLRVNEPTASTLFPGDSVDLSLEANAIALRYLNDSQLSKLSLGGHAPRPATATSSSSDSLLSPNMSLATRKYMRRYGLIEEEDEEEVVVARQPLTEALNVKLLPQSQLIRDLRPKMQLLAGSAKPNAANKENCSSRQPALLRASSQQIEGSVGNILDLSRLRQLPKLF